MRILFIHSDNIEYETLFKMKMAEENIIPIYAMQDALGVRCKDDRRDESAGKKVREAVVEWVPSTIVVGDGEIDSGKYSVSIRSKSQSNKPFKVILSLDELVANVRADVCDMPNHLIYTTKLMSKRARYY